MTRKWNQWIKIYRQFIFDCIYLHIFSGYVLFHSISIIIVRIKSGSFTGNLSAIFHHAKCSKSCEISSTYQWCPGSLNLQSASVAIETINSSPFSVAYMRQWIGSSLFQVMACRLFGAKSLPEPMLAYCQFDPWEQISVNFLIGIIFFSFTKMHLKMSSTKMAAVLSRGMS